MRKKEKSTIVSLLLLHAAGATALSALIPLVGIYILEVIDFPSWGMSLYITELTLAIVVLNRYLARFIDRTNFALHAEFYAMACYIFATLLLMSRPSFSVIALILPFIMAFANSHNVIIYSISQRISRQSSDMHLKLFSWLRMAGALGWVIGPLLSFLLLKKGDIGLSVLCTLSLGLVWGAAWIIAFRKARTAQGQKRTKGAEETPQSEMHLAAIWSALLIVVCFAANNIVFVSLLPAALIKHNQFLNVAPGMFIAIKSAIELVATLSGTILLRRMKPRNMLTLASLFSLAASCTMGLSETMSGFLVASALQGFAFGFFGSSALLLLQTLALGKPGMVNGRFVSCQFIGSFVGSCLFGVMSHLQANGVELELLKLFSVFAVASAALLNLVSFRKSSRLNSSLPTHLDT